MSNSGNYLHIYERPHPLLGRHINHDPRSRDFAVSPLPASGTLINHKWLRSVPIFDQGQLGSCVPNAALGALGTGPLYTALAVNGIRLDYSEATALDWYRKVTATDDVPGQYPPDDTGSDGLSMAKLLKRMGLTPSYRHAFSTTAAFAALQIGPGLMGSNWYSSMFNPDANGFVEITPGASVAGGHEYVVDEINDVEKWIGFANSWGDGWGLAGHARMTFATFNRLMREQGDFRLLAPVKATTHAPSDAGASDEVNNVPAEFVSRVA